MNYRKLVLDLRYYGRKRRYDLVSSVFNPGIRQDAKYLQWRRLVDRAEILAMSLGERAFLMDLLGVSTAVTANRILSGR